VIAFIEECRREWRRLGVPDAISNEMAADLTADIEEAEAEGGSAEDVLGNSLFDPQRFAAAWASARGVCPSSLPAPDGPSTLPARDRPRWHGPVVALAGSAAVLIIALVAAAAVVGRHGSAVAAPVRRVLEVPGSTAVIPSGLAVPPFRYSASGASFVVQQAEPVTALLFALLAVVTVALGLAVFFWSPWFRRNANGGIR
jgi:hypothetical protein